MLSAIHCVCRWPCIIVRRVLLGHRIASFCPSPLFPQQILIPQNVPRLFNPLGKKKTTTYFHDDWSTLWTSDFFFIIYYTLPRDNIKSQSCTDLIHETLEINILIICFVKKKKENNILLLLLSCLLTKLVKQNCF